DQQIACDPVHPRTELANREIVPRLIEDPEQRLLSQVFRELHVAGIAIEEPDQLPLVPLDQLVERTGVAALDADHQLIVVHAVPSTAKHVSPGVLFPVVPALANETLSLAGMSLEKVPFVAASGMTITIVRNCGE